MKSTGNTKSLSTHPSSQTPMQNALWNQDLDRLLHRLSIRIKQLVVADYRRATRFYVSFLLLLTVGYLCVMPIGSGDTDLWYHLNGGRLLAEFGQFPDTAFYSFVDSERGWINYFWGFQALAYQIYKYLGYEGLLLLRVVLVCIAFLSVTAILVRPNDNLTQRTWALVLLSLVLLVLVGRTDLIRPHLISYCMISVFLLILHHRREWLPALPILTVVWINLHGTEWPVGALICGAYFLDAFWRRMRDPQMFQATDRNLLIWTALCIPAMFLNPFGVEVLWAPFNFPTEIYSYIGELKPYSILALFSISLSGPILSLGGAVGFLNWGNLLAYGFLFTHRKLRFTPFILSLAGLYLVSRGSRFLWEWLLLSIPLWRSAIDAVAHPSERTGYQGLGPLNLVVFVILVAPLVSWVIQVKNIHHWPVDESKLPIGTGQFLAEQRVAGKLVVSPNLGGYLAWRLFPEVLISGDMQIPPTTPWDHYRWAAAQRNPEALQRYIAEFRPQLIAAEITHKTFAGLIERHPQYRAVYFDDLLALYADLEQLPAFVAAQELKHVNPFNLLDKKGGNVDERLTELKRILKTQAGGTRVQHAVTRLLFDESRFEEALPYARRFADSVPEDPNSHYLLGNVLENLNRCDEAPRHYNDAFAVAPADFHAVLHRHLGTCAYLEKDFSAAYDHFSKGVNSIAGNEAPENLYQFAVSAVAVGDDYMARTLLERLLYAAPPADDHTTLRAKALLEDL